METDNKFTQQDAAHVELGDEKLQGTHLVDQAKDSDDQEHTITVVEAVKAYPMAIFWSLMVSMCVVMEGTLICPQRPCQIRA
jgi:hypothetical protein